MHYTQKSGNIKAQIQIKMSNDQKCVFSHIVRSWWKGNRGNILRTRHKEEELHAWKCVILYEGSVEFCIRFRHSFKATLVPAPSTPGHQDFILWTRHKAFDTERQSRPVERCW